MADDTKKTAEEWATEAKLLPQMVERPAEGRRPARVVTNPDYWKFAAARLGAGWVVGEELTSEEFDDAVAKWTGDPIHGGRDVGETQAQQQERLAKEKTAKAAAQAPRAAADAPKKGPAPAAPAA